MLKMLFMQTRRMDQTVFPRIHLKRYLFFVFNLYIYIYIRADRSFCHYFAYKNSCSLFVSLCITRSMNHASCQFIATRCLSFSVEDTLR